jgi:hypothetical protein
MRIELPRARDFDTRGFTGTSIRGLTYPGGKLASTQAEGGANSAEWKYFFPYTLLVAELSSVLESWQCPNLREPFTYKRENLFGCFGLQSLLF